jgi:hypothetical protein
MDWLTFLTKIIEALSWPMALLISVLLIRRPLLTAVPFLRKLKYSDVEIEFTQEVSSLRREVSEVKSETNLLVSDSPRIPDHVLQLAAISPRAAVLEAWKEVENAVIELARRNPEGVKNTDLNSIPSLVEALEKHKKLESTLADLYRRQKALNKRFAWTGESTVVNPDDAMELTDLHIALAASIRRAA